MVLGETRAYLRKGRTEAFIEIKRFNAMTGKREALTPREIRVSEVFHDGKQLVGEALSDVIKLGVAEVQKRAQQTKATLARLDAAIAKDAE